MLLINGILWSIETSTLLISLKQLSLNCKEIIFLIKWYSREENINLHTPPLFLSSLNWHCKHSRLWQKTCKKSSTTKGQFELLGDALWLYSIRCYNSLATRSWTWKLSSACHALALFICLGWACMALKWVRGVTTYVYPVSKALLIYTFAST